MKYFYPKYQKLHKPRLDLSDGLPGVEHLEISSRVDGVLEGLLKASKCEVVYVTHLADEEVRKIHEDAYVDFLLAISETIGEDEEYIPSIFRKDMSASPLHFQGGMYCDEIGTPIGKQSIKAALNSAATALDAADYVNKTGKSAFALTRPPGHHAGKRRYGGYCFFNNAYLAANSLVEKGKKVAVIDIDYHIGDGSIEFATQNMPYYSINASAHRSYPYLEPDFPMQSEHVHVMEFKDGTSGAEYIKQVKALLVLAVDTSVDVVVLSLGFDTLATDGYQDDKIYVSVADFRTIGELFGALNQEVLMVLEGGYDAKELSLCAYEFMSGFQESKG